MKIQNLKTEGFRHMKSNDAIDFVTSLMDFFDDSTFVDTVDSISYTDKENSEKRVELTFKAKKDDKVFNFCGIMVKSDKGMVVETDFVQMNDEDFDFEVKVQNRINRIALDYRFY